MASPGPPLASVTVKPMGLPALTVALSAVLVSVTLGHWTVTDAEAVGLPSLVVVTDAWLG